MSKDITPQYEIIALRDKVLLPDQTGFADQVGGLGTRLSSTVSEAINTSGNLVKDVINSKLDTAAKTILDSFTFGHSGALQIGEYSSGVSGDIRISPNGIIGRDETDSNTFTIDATTGNATFSGDITGSTGTFGSVIINSGTISWGTVSGTTDAPDNNATDGATFGTNVSGGGTGTNYVNNNGYITALTGSSITTGTLTVGSSSVGITVDSGGDILFNSTSSSSYSQLVFEKVGTSNYGWEIHYVSTGGGGYNAGDFQFLPMSNNPSNIVRIGTAVQTGKLVVHGTFSSKGVTCDDISCEDISCDDISCGDISCDDMECNALITTIWKNSDNDSEYIQFASNGLETTENFYAAGDLSCGGTKSFKIDHPLKPSTHYLLHSSIESDEMMNVYKGNSYIKNGICEIQMPDWFTPLNGKNKDDYSYSLTSIGNKNDLWVKEEIEDGKVVFAGNNDGKFSYVIYAIRHDKHAENNRMKVEVLKKDK